MTKNVKEQAEEEEEKKKNKKKKGLEEELYPFWSLVILCIRMTDLSSEHLKIISQSSPLR